MDRFAADGRPIDVALAIYESVLLAGVGSYYGGYD